MFDYFFNQNGKVKKLTSSLAALCEKKLLMKSSTLLKLELSGR